MTGVLVLIGALAVATVLGLAWRASQGRIRRRETTALPEPVRGLVDASAAVTLVQLSTTFCAPCRHTRTLLGDLAEGTDGLRHVDFDITDHPDVAARLGVVRTPTTLAVDARGVELLRVGGVPRRDSLLEALRPHLPSPI